MFSGNFDKQGEGNQELHEIELFLNLNINQYLTESEIGKIDIISPITIKYKKKRQKNLVGDLINLIEWQFIFLTLLKWKVQVM